MDCYQMAGVLLKNLGVRGLPVLASFRAQRVAEELHDPAWLGLAAWVRGFALGGKGRPRMLELSVQGADALQGHLGDPRAQQMSLAVLSACHSGGGLAQELVRIGIPIVVAMQYQIEATHSIEFNKSFYASLFSGATVDEAVSCGRIRLYEIGAHYGRPVLYHRSDVGAFLGTITGGKLIRSTHRRNFGPLACRA